MMLHHQVDQTLLEMLQKLVGTGGEVPRDIFDDAQSFVGPDAS